MCMIQVELFNTVTCNTVDIHLKKHSNPDCTCDNYVSKRRGLPKQLKNQINTIITTQANAKPFKTKDIIIQQQMNTHTSTEQLLDVNSHQKRKAVSSQLINNINYTKKKARRNGTIATEKLTVGDIMDFKKKYLFTTPDEATQTFKRRSRGTTIGSKVI